MNGREEKHVSQATSTLVTHPFNKTILRSHIKDKPSDLTYYIKSKIRRIKDFFVHSAKDIYDAIAAAFSIDQMDFNHFRKYILPIAMSGLGLVLTELLGQRTRDFHGYDEEYDFVYRLLLSTALLSLSAVHRVTEQQPKTDVELSLAVTADAIWVLNMYLGAYQGSRMLLQDHLSDNTSLVASLGMAGLAVPGTVALLVKKCEEKIVKRHYAKGSQRVDSAIIASGLSPVSNIYFQGNYFMISEMSVLSRLFQLGLISKNILDANDAIQQFRNLPALGTDVGPALIKSLVMQQEKIAADRKHNTSQEKVLVLGKQGVRFKPVKRHQLKSDDLVYTDRFNLESVPVSGELEALQRDDKGALTAERAFAPVSVNLQAHTGENIWIKQTTRLGTLKQVDLHAIRDRKQVGILAGGKLDLHGSPNFFVRIKDRKERTFNNDFVKTAIINQIIIKHKQRAVMYSTASSLVLAQLLSHGVENIPAQTISFMFTIFQMMIPFSETFLRDMVNSRLMRELNRELADAQMKTIDALRIVDFCNALSGYYSHRFSQGMAVISDKTGTLTTPKMQVLGFWTADMKPDVSGLLQEKKRDLLVPNKCETDCFEVFASAFTHSKKELEPEEHAILKMFQEILRDEKCLVVHKDHLGDNYFRKTLRVNSQEKTIDTLHLGLCRKLGGRLTLVEEDKKKFLVFCGVPKADTFAGTDLLTKYNAMEARKGVLSRDWCIARVEITPEHFNKIKELFLEDRQKVNDIETFVCDTPRILHHFTHYCTFLIDNPVKKAAEKFISQCKQARVPVFIATGDTAKAAENIAKVLSPESTREIAIIRPADVGANRREDYGPDATIIFAGIDPSILDFFHQLMTLDISKRPVIIFSEMSTAGKGLLAQALKQSGFFVVANGDGSNDIAMMKHAHVVFGHVTEEGSYAPEVGQYVDLGDRQLQRLFRSEQSFYELFDIHHPDSLFMRLFARLVNSQEKPSLALIPKGIKMHGEWMQVIGMPDVQPLPHQHWWSIGFDLYWILKISFDEILRTADLPSDNEPLDVSRVPHLMTLATMALSFLQAAILYSVTGESTRIDMMVLMLAFLPTVLNSVFCRYGEAQEEKVHERMQLMQLMPPEEKQLIAEKSKPGFFSKLGLCSRRQKHQVLEEREVHRLS